MKKTALLFLALSSISFAGSKHYDVSFGSPAILGTAQVESGQYELSYDGSKVTLVNATNHKKVETTATAMTSEKKYKDTIVNSKHVDGMDHVGSIQLGGTTTALQFAD